MPWGHNAAPSVFRRCSRHGTVGIRFLGGTSLGAIDQCQRSRLRSSRYILPLEQAAAALVARFGSAARA